MEFASAKRSARTDSDGFRLYFDEALSSRTGYHSDNDYFNKAKDRMDRTFKLIEPKVPNSDILDIGASPFYLLYKARTLGARSCHGVYFAHDNHPLKGIPRIWSTGGPIELHHVNIEEENLPFPDNSFDIITACEVLEHLERFPFRFAREVHRLLRPNGLLCVTVPNVCSIGNIVKLIFQRNIYYKYRSDPTGRHRHEYTLGQMKALFSFMGLDVRWAGFLPSPTSHLSALRPAYRAIAMTPGLRHYSPVLCVVGRQPDPKRTPEFSEPPSELYTEDRSIEE